MADLIFVPLAGVGTLAMTREQFDAALSAGRGLVKAPAAPMPGTSAAPDAKLLDSEQLEERTGIPSSWWMAQARERRIPYRKIGRRVRFALDEILACEALKRREIANGDTLRR